MQLPMLCTYIDGVMKNITINSLACGRLRPHMSGYCSKLWLNNIVAIYILPSILVACPLAASRLVHPCRVSVAASMDNRLVVQCLWLLWQTIGL